jgi:hypothetical protein
MVINRSSLTTPGEGTHFPNATILVTCNKARNIQKKNVILKGVGVTNAAAENKEVLYILSVCF